MPILTIRHVTTYRYRQPVAFGEHRMMLRPRDASDQRVLEASIEISPEPKSLRFVQDGYGNHLGIARFSGHANELSFESIVRVEHSRLAKLHERGCSRAQAWWERMAKFLAGKSGDSSKWQSLLVGQAYSRRRTENTYYKLSH